MKIQLPATIKKIAELQFKATTCGFERLETDRDRAGKALSAAIADQLHNSFTRAYRWANDGTLFVLYYSDGWKYDIIGEAHARRGCPCTCSAGSFGCDYREALDCMEKHVGGYCDTETTLADMLRRNDFTPAAPSEDAGCASLREFPRLTPITEVCRPWPKTEAV